MNIHYCKERPGVEIQCSRAEVFGISKSILINGATVECSPCEPFGGSLVLKRIRFSTDAGVFMTISVTGDELQFKGAIKVLKRFSTMLEDFADTWSPPHAFHHDYSEGHQLLAKGSIGMVIDIVG